VQADDNPDIFSLNIGWDVARVFVMCAAMTVLPPDFLNVYGDSNQDISGPFRHFGYFSLLSTNSFILANLLQHWHTQLLKCTPLS
jgi:hypothetical protein